MRSATRARHEGTDCGAVKLGAGAWPRRSATWSSAAFPSWRTSGLTPQSINVIGGFKAQGREREAWAAIEEDARLVAEAGAFAVVLEAVAELLAARITAAIPIPTIGIGAGAGCDGQILVMEDMLGLSPRVPKFVKEFGKIGAAIEGDPQLRRRGARGHVPGGRARLRHARGRTGSAGGRWQRAAGPQKDENSEHLREPGRR